MCRSVKCLLVNIRSLRRNLNEFLCILETAFIKPEVLVFTEIWIYSHETGLYTIPGYRGYFTCQDSGVAGGVAVYVRDDLPSYSVGKYTRNVEACIVDAQVEGYWLRITGMYRSPNHAFSNLEQFIETDLANVSKIGLEKPLDRLIAGDLNLDVSKHVLKTDQYMNVLAEYGYEWLETGVTRQGKIAGHGTVIDHTFIKTLNIIDASCKILELPTDLDHNILNVNVTFPSKNLKPPKRQSHINWYLFSEIFSKENFASYFDERDPSSACQILYNKITKCKNLATRQIKSAKKGNH